MDLNDDGRCRGDASGSVRFEEGVEGFAPFRGLRKDSPMDELCGEVLWVEEGRYCSRREIIQVVDTVIDFHLRACFRERSREMEAVEEIGKVD